MAGVVHHIAEGDQRRAGVGGERERRSHGVLQHSQQVFVAAVEVVARRRAVGAAIAARVGDDHAEIAREIWDLGLELPAVNHGLALWEQHEVATAPTRGLPEELDAAIAHIHGFTPPRWWDRSMRSRFTRQ